MEVTDIDRNEKDSAGVEQLHDENVPAEPARCAHGAIAELCPSCSKPDEPPADDLGSYDAMFATYLHEQRLWIGAAQQPLVFHIRKLCRRLDADPEASASIASAYLQAISRLDKQRPGNTQPAGAAGDLPGQGSIFDELD